MTLLVTGAGLIGSLTAAMASARGYNVVLTDIAPDLLAIRAVGYAGEIVQGDMGDADWLEGMIQSRNVSQVVHTATVQTPSLNANPVSGLSFNIGTPVHLLDLARRGMIGRVVLASSGTVYYGTFENGRAEAIDEDFAYRTLSQRPRSLYAVAKLAVEQLALQFHGLYGVDAICLRFAAVIGAWDGHPGLPSEAILSLIRAALAGMPPVTPEPRLTWGGTEEFVDARDCARAALAALEASNLLRRVYNVATGEVVSHAELKARIETALGLPLSPPASPVGHGFAGYPFVRPAPSAVGSAEREIGFKTAYTLADSVGWMIDHERQRKLSTRVLGEPAKHQSGALAR